MTAMRILERSRKPWRHNGLDWEKRLREPFIAKEGSKLVIASFIFSLVLFFIHYSVLTTILAVIVFIFCFFCLYFFRNPKRNTQINVENLISPADGTVTEIKNMMETEFIGGECVRISIFMSPLDVHVNRSPCEGRVVKVLHISGEFAVAFKKDIDKENERNNILIEHKNEKILVVQIAGFLARRIIPYVKETDVVKQGDPIGIIAFGSRVDIYFPKMYEPVVQLQEKVKAGLSVVARKKGIK
jgi:phosphatidylserine decarboxylase